MTITWHRNPSGTGTTTVTEGAAKPGLTRYTIVDRTDRTAMAAWKAGVAPAEDADECDECPPGRPCWCTAGSTDPIDY